MEAKPPLFANEIVPENSNVPVLLMPAIPDDTPPITPSLTARQRLMAPGWEKSNRE